MSWTIDKEFSFEMGHRVWAQQLTHPSLSISTDCCCRHLHGHSYTIKVCLTADSLDSSNMVTDFKNINFMKEFVDVVLDHKFMVDINDPMFERITGVLTKQVAGFTNFSNLLGLLQTSGAQFTPTVSELYGSFVLVDFVPTSENICKYLKQYAQHRLGSVAKVSALELWETKKSHCVYTGE